MKISHEPGYEEEWICLCGNRAHPMAETFHPCDAQGNPVESEEWTTNWAVCDQCGRIIDSVTLEVVGRRQS
jgi:hypothetical protein